MFHRKIISSDCTIAFDISKYSLRFKKLRRVALVIFFFFSLSLFSFFFFYITKTNKCNGLERSQFFVSVRLQNEYIICMSLERFEILSFHNNHIKYNIIIIIFNLIIIIIIIIIYTYN